MASPPFTTLTTFAAVVAEQVPDTKATRTDADLVLDAAERYAEDYPNWEQADIGDGATREWDLAVAPFNYAAGPPPTGFVFGYSDLWPIQCEDLASAAVSQRPASLRQFGKFGEACDAWIEERTVAGVQKKYLVFDSAPSTSLMRVHWRKRWSIPAAGTTTVPLHHQMAVVDLACALKCEILASVYRRSVDSVGGSDVFNAIEVADSYAKQAQGFWAAYRRALGIASGSVPTMATGRIRTGRARVFPRGVA